MQSQGRKASFKDSGPQAIKIVVMGDVAVGKTSLVTRMVHNTFEENQVTTIGASFLAKIVKMQGEEIKLNIWDTAGQEKYRSMVPLYYKNADAAILVFDLTSNESLHQLEMWVKDLKEQGPPNVALMIAANKQDIYDNA